MKKYWPILLWYTMLFSFVLTSCDDVLVPDISDEKLSLLSPGDSVLLSRYNVDFVWEEVDGTENYRLQVVSPSFNAIQYFALDSITSEKNMGAVLNPGEYQWKVIARNSASELESSIRSFVVDTNATSVQEVILLTPNDNYVTNLVKHQFRWQSYSGANDYRFDLRQNMIDGNRVYSEITEYDTLHYEFSSEGEFYWGIQAQKQFGAPSVFSYNKIIVDTTSPSNPSIIEPTNNETINSFPIVFTWNNPTGVVISDEFDSLWVYNILQNDTVLEFSERLSVKEFNLDTLKNGVYMTEVKTFDNAGNSSNKSGPISFSVQYP